MSLSALALVRRGLRHHWRGHLAVALGIAIAGSVLVGALIVGDSVRASLRALVSERLGGAEVAIVTHAHGVRSSLAGELQASLGAETQVAPILTVNAVLSTPEDGGVVAGVTLLGVTKDYWRALGQAPPATLEEALRPNRALAERLSRPSGAPLIIRVGHAGPAADTPMALAPSEVLSGTLPMGDPIEGPAGAFSLQVHGPPSLNALVPLGWLGALSGQGDRANLLLIRGATQEAVSASLKDRWTLDDMGLTLSEVGDEVALRSASIVLPPAIDEALAGEPGARTLTWFANALESGERATPYSFVAATERAPINALTDDEIAINRWLASDLGLELNDTLTLVYPTFGPRRTQGESRRDFKVAKILEMSGLGADPSLSVTFPGFSSARSCREWEPGVQIDLARLRKEDEAYWARHRGAPKAFVNLRVGQAMWQNPYGNLTEVRRSGAAAGDMDKRLTGQISPETMGIHVLPIAADALSQASPTTDFGELFIGLGGLLILAAMLLVMLLMRLSALHRAEEEETLKALGLREATRRRLALAEGGSVVCLGALLGCLGAWVVAEATLAGLQGIWSGALGGLNLHFDASPQSLIIGPIATALCGLVALGWIGRRPRALETSSGPRGPALLALLALSGALASLWGLQDRPMLAYFAAGGLTLTGALAGLKALLERPRRAALTGLAAMSWSGLKMRSRSTLWSVALLAVGTFVVVGVGVNRHDAEAVARTSAGTGGFSLLGQSRLGVTHSLNSEAGLGALGLSSADLLGSKIVQLRVRPGDDASCLNLAQAPRPALYGVEPELMAQREAFGEVDWNALKDSDALGEAPYPIVAAIGDTATLTWRLKLGLGDVLMDVDERGRPYGLQIVGKLPTSILQGGLLVDLDALSARFPTSAQDTLFLIDAPQAHAREVSRLLEDALGDRGFVTRPTLEILGAYLRVENTYLAIFLALGGLALLLGVPGVGVVLFRQILTRRSELAVLVAMGWRMERLRRLLLLEQGTVVVLGVLIGGSSAALAVRPALSSTVSRAPGEAALLLGLGVISVGLLAVFVSVQVAMRGRLTEALHDGA